MFDVNPDDSKRVGTIVVYPEQGARHSSEKDLCALAGYSKSLLGNLPQEDRAQHVVFSNVKTRRGNEFEDNGLLVVECWDKGRLWYWLQIVRTALRFRKLRVVHLQHEFNQFGRIFTVPLIPVLLLVLRAVLGVRIVVTFHEVLSGAIITPEFVKRTRIPMPAAVARLGFRWYYRIVSFLADRVVVQDDHFGAVLEKEYGIRTPKTVIHIGADATAVLSSQSEARRKLGLDDSKKVLLFFGALDWRKGLETLLDAYRLLPVGRYQLVLAGGQPPRIRHTAEYQQWYHALLSKMEGLPDVRMSGFIPDSDIESFFAAADLVVLPYLLPQLESAVINTSISYETPFITTPSFRGRVDELAICEPDPETLAAKIRWCFDGNLPALLEYVRREKGARDWSHASRAQAAVYEGSLRRD